MAASVQDQPAGQVAQALVAFSLHGSFPDEDVSSLQIRPEELPSAIQALAETKAKLEVCLRFLTVADVLNPSANSFLRPKYTG